MIYNRIAYKLRFGTIEVRLAEHRNQEVKYREKIRILEFNAESRANCIERLTKELELIKKEKGELETKLTGFPSASKDLDNLLESQRSDKNKEGLGYSVVPPPPAQVYSLPIKDMSWTGLSEFADDTITDYSRPSPTIESNTDDTNRNLSVSKIGESTANCTEVKTNKVEAARNSSVRYAKMYIRTSKSTNVRGNQRNWNNLKSQQLGNNFVMKNKACFNCGDFDHFAYEFNTARPKAVINRRNWVNDVKTSACWVWKPVKPNSASIILKRYDYIDVRGRSSHRGRTKSLSDGIPIKHRKVLFYLLGYRRRGTTYTQTTVVLHQYAYARRRFSCMVQIEE
nr:retrotransposon Orf1 [Tanacetum cinerariifolium]